MSVGELVEIQTEKEETQSVDNFVLWCENACSRKKSYYRVCFELRTMHFNTCSRNEFYDLCVEGVFGSVADVGADRKSHKQFRFFELTVELYIVRVLVVGQHDCPVDVWAVDDVVC